MSALELTAEWIPVDDAALGIVPPPSPPLAFFDPPRNAYWFQNSRGGWITLPEAALKRQLRPYLSNKAAETARLSPLDEHINKLQTECDVAYAGPLAGAPPGLREYESRRLLITEGPQIIEPVPGEWPVLSLVLENLLVDERGDQRPYFYGWLKIARESLIAQVHRPGQALVLAGQHDSGKSLVQNLITPLLGGRAAKPYGWMTGATDFNAELFGAEHLVIEDEFASTDIRARRNFGAQIKSVTVNSLQKCHQKNRTALSLEPFWRVTITVNDEPENLMVLPPFDDSVADKIILLRANKRPMPMPTATYEERKAFMATLTAELPAFCHFLSAYAIPAEHVSHRFGITHYHHPDLLNALDELAPETRLLQLLETAITESWTGSQAQLEALLTGPDAETAYEARRLFSFPNACGVYLARLAKKRPDAVRYRRTGTSRTWTIWPDREPAQGPY
ncbi:hypothetical protein K0B96_08875 [Horticoccus luteus]|uniref:Uncharacterized protein n=1 Tax=Horticoccus luteus TaxID=2862869 RepID=A0A8F9XN14_9BACT|nr:hypothetical protein [Horticoccus luteus]QYM80694.1 hypothetical protein K0B96_08875 [Horticoccus luteus]